jgi:hypothetical protein
MVAPITIHSTPTATGIQNGAVTHHHDQLITLHSFSTIKVMPSKPHTPTPPDAVVFLLSIDTSIHKYSWLYISYYDLSEYQIGNKKLKARQL